MTTPNDKPATAQSERLQHSSLVSAHLRFYKAAHFRHDDFCDACHVKFFNEDRVSVRTTEWHTLMIHAGCKELVVTHD